MNHGKAARPLPPDRRFGTARRAQCVCDQENPHYGLNPLCSVNRSGYRIVLTDD